ncbi:unnamed protein product [Cylindrotheca closterium]|uniref:Uncharacterized protein n=1 Tax=Cylindrotheca closterium TaxID=2856 RepID=A0AAD2G0X9_9STRA|nr:unnamed protein product [Cylindrotheca closterium]
MVENAHNDNDGMQCNRIVTSSRLLHHAVPSRWIRSDRPFYCFRSKSFQGFSTRRSFSSSKKTKQEPPKLSRRGKVDLFLIITVALGSWLYLRDSDWDRDAWNEKEKLLDIALLREKEKNTTKSATQESHDRLPMPLRKYLDTAMANVPGTTPNDSKSVQKRARVVSVDQTGMFFASQQWYPFRSNLLTKTVFHQDDFPGFVWEASVTIMGMPNKVLETYSNGQGGIITKAWGKVPLIQVEEEEPYILFWLAMAPLIPSTFDPNSESPEQSETSQPLITWNSVQDLTTCSGTMVDRATNERFEMELQFDPTTYLLQSIRVTSPCLPHPWQVQYSNYQVLRGNDEDPRSGVLVPCEIEVGKWKPDDGHLDLHLKITNQHMQDIPLHDKANGP